MELAIGILFDYGVAGFSNPFVFTIVCRILFHQTWCLNCGLVDGFQHLICMGAISAKGRGVPSFHSGVSDTTDAGR